MKLPLTVLTCCLVLFTATAAIERSPKAKAAAPKKPAAKTEKNDSSEKPFADVVKDFEVIEGMFTFYRKDDKVYLEILPWQFDLMFLCSPTLESGLGERGLLSAQVLEEFVFTFHRQGKKVQLLKKNVRYRAEDHTPIHRAVERSFADSVLNSAKVESAPHPKRNSVLVELNGLFLTDLPMLGYFLEYTYRWPYKLDAGNSAFGPVKAFPLNCELEALLNFAIERPPVPPLQPPAGTPAPPLAPADPRSLPLRVRYSLSMIPQTKFRPRLADDRVGHFVAMHQDFTSDREDTPYVRYVTRWNLEKTDPDAPLSPPKEPIVFWLENTVPVQYRAALTEGVLLWNQAFERIGFKDAIVVKQQPEASDWDPADARYNTIRWFIATDTGFAIGPSRPNPFTGQIYDADIAFSESMTRSIHRNFSEFAQPASDAPTAWEAAWSLSRNPRCFCNFAEFAGSQAAFGHGILETRGALADPKAEEQFVHDWLVCVAAHEVGHTLGLRHNFRASNILPSDKLQDAGFTRKEGLTGSVMEYAPVNLAPPGQKQGQYWQTTLGPYDYWAIEYAYKPLAAKTPQDEKTELAKIASRVAEPLLAYSTDEDTFGWSREPVGIDPRSSWGDLGSDPLTYYAGRAKVVRELWGNLESRLAKPGEGYQVLRRGFDRGFWEMWTVMLGASKYVGGIYHSRDHAGDPGDRPPYQPVPAEKQRQALELLKEHAFGATAFDFPPSLLNKLAKDRTWTFEGEAFEPRQRLDYPLHDRVLALHRELLDRLFHPLLLRRLQDLPVKYADPKDAFAMADLFQGLQDAVWSELKPPAGGVEINSFRRALQREHLKRLTRLLLRPEASAPEDATTLARFQLIQLRGQMQPLLADQALKSDLTTRAHLDESLARIEEALKAQQHRAAN